MNEKASDTESAELQLALGMYASAREELISRIGHRDQALVIFLGAVGVIFSAAVTGFSERYPMLLIVPLLGLGATFVAMQHHTIIGALGQYVGRELGEYIDARSPGSSSPPQWDHSFALMRARPVAFGHRLSAHLTLLVAPQVAAVGTAGIALGYHLDQVPGPDWLAFAVAAVLGLAPAGWSAFLVVQATRLRSKMWTEPVVSRSLVEAQQ